MPETFTPLSPAMFSRDGKLSVPAPPVGGAAVVSPSASSAAPTATPTPANCSAQPVVTLQRNGDVVTAIKVQCTCGQVIELNCRY